MQDEFDADGYEPEHDQYLDNDDEPSELHGEDDEDGEFDDEDGEARGREELGPDDEEELDEDYDSPHWDDL